VTPVAVASVAFAVAVAVATLALGVKFLLRERAEPAGEPAD
jgi:hypothetical protein